MHLPARFAAVIVTFTPLFLQQRTWRHAELLLIGAILAPGKRTVTRACCGLVGSVLTAGPFWYGVVEGRADHARSLFS
jgi:hypothetical protein